MTTKDTTVESMLWYGHNIHGDQDFKEVPVRARKLFRLAFGRYRGTPEHRRSAAPLIAKLQDHDRWLFCGCQDALGEKPKPILIPVERSFIRRHPQFSGHDPLCPYAVDREKQLQITRSFRKTPTDSIFKLLQGYSRETEQGHPEDHRSPGHDLRRSRLAKLLFAIMDQSGLQQIIVGSPTFTPPKQYEAIKNAAEQFKLARNVPVGRVLCTDLSRVRTYLANFDNRVLSARWDGHPRPHAILLCMVRGTQGNELIGFNEVRERVDGPITMFGRAKNKEAKLSTFMAIGLLGKQTTTGPSCILRAYLHPCVSAGNLMLVDSGYERRTLKRLTEDGTMTQFVIEKPLHDFGVAQSGEQEDITEADKAELTATGAPPVIKPDFVLWRDRKPPIVVETMGFKFDWYRDRKREIVPQMASALGTKLIVEHDFHRPVGVSQDDRDEIFREALTDSFRS